MPVRPQIQAQSLLRGGRASTVHLTARSAIAPASAPIPLGRASSRCRGYHVSSKLLASNGANSSFSSGTSQNASVHVSGWSSGSVLAVAAAAAISGWGLSSFVPLQNRDTRSKSKNKGQSNQDNDDAKESESKKDKRKDHVSLAENDNGEVGFANRSEMQEAS